MGVSACGVLAIADHEISRITELYRDRDYALTRANEVISLEDELNKPLPRKSPLSFNKIRSVKLNPKKADKKKLS